MSHDIEIVSYLCPNLKTFACAFDKSYKKFTFIYDLYRAPKNDNFLSMHGIDPKSSGNV